MIPTNIYLKFIKNDYFENYPENSTSSISVWENMNCTGIVMTTFYQSFPDTMTIPDDLLIMMNLYNHRGMVLSIQQ